MRLRRLATLVLAVFLVGGLSAAVAGGSFADGTSAAWTDRTQVSAKVTAGTWSTTTPSTCVAYDQSGAALADACVLNSTSSYQQWGSGEALFRGYDLRFEVPASAVTISFDIDLGTIAGSSADGGTWSWQSPKQLQSSQFSVQADWVCSELPRLRGVSKPWQTQSLYLLVSGPTTATDPPVVQTCL